MTTLNKRNELVSTCSQAKVSSHKGIIFKTALDCGFHAMDSRFPGTGFQSLSVELGFRIAIVSGIPDSLSCIPDSTSNFSQILDSTIKNVLDSGIRIRLHEAKSSYSN